MNFGILPQRPGLYWLESLQAQKKLYIGKTFDLRRRFQLQFKGATFNFWETAQSDLRLRYCELDDADSDLLDANQSRWIGNWRPVGNCIRFAAS
jgi:predicted GIY-YIG superfamily endonuclease